MKFRELLKLLEKNGWTLVRTRGSHKQFKHPNKTGTVTLAGKPNIEVPIGTLKNILKQAKIELD